MDLQSIVVNDSVLAGYILKDSCGGMGGIIRIQFHCFAFQANAGWGVLCPQVADLAVMKGLPFRQNRNDRQYRNPIDVSKI